MQTITQDILKSYTLEIAPTASGTLNIWNFPDIPFLRNKKAFGIEATINSKGVTTGKTNLFSQPTFTDAGFITLVDVDGIQFVQQMPLIELRSGWYLDVAANISLPHNTNAMPVFSPRFVQWNKCSVYFPVAQSTANCLQFTIYYQ